MRLLFEIWQGNGPVTVQVLQSLARFINEAPALAVVHLQIPKQQVKDLLNDTETSTAVSDAYI